MVVSSLGYVLLGAFLLVLYVWPAYARLWRPFAVSMSVAIVTLVLFWVSAFVGPIAMEYPRGLAAAIDLALRAAATAYLMMACALQGVRHWAVANEVTAYRHWVFVVLGAILAPVLIIPFV